MCAARDRDTGTTPAANRTVSNVRDLVQRLGSGGNPSSSSLDLCLSFDLEVGVRD